MERVPRLVIRWAVCRLCVEEWLLSAVICLRQSASTVVKLTLCIAVESVFRLKLAYIKLVLVWLSANALVSINVVTLRGAHLLPVRLTILGQVNHPGTEPGTQVNSA